MPGGCPGGGRLKLRFDWYIITTMNNKMKDDMDTNLYATYMYIYVITTVNNKIKRYIHI